MDVLHWVRVRWAPVMRLLSMEESDRRSIFSPEVDRSASSEGAGAASARLSCRCQAHVITHQPVS